MSLIDTIIKQIESLDYLVAERIEGEIRVMVAEPIVPIDPQKAWAEAVAADGAD